MSQNEFNQFYDGLRKYATYRASRMIRDTALRGDAIDAAMDRVVDRLLKGDIKGNKEAYCKTIIRNSIYSSITRSKVRPVSLKGSEFDQWGFGGRIIKE